MQSKRPLYPNAHEIKRVVQVPAGRSVAIDRKENEEINVVDRGNCVYISKKLNPLGSPRENISTNLKKQQWNILVFHFFTSYSLPFAEPWWKQHSNTCLQPPWNRYLLTMAYSGQD